MGWKKFIAVLLDITFVTFFRAKYNIFRSASYYLLMKGFISTTSSTGRLNKKDSLLYIRLGNSCSNSLLPSFPQNK
jgi:hypothetical protein